jgi:hypothetical protein
MLEFAGVIQRVDPAGLHSYQIDVTREVRSGNDVLVPRLKTPNMQAVLALFQGKTPLVGAPADQPASVDTTAPAAQGFAPAATPSTVADTTPPPTLPADNAQGVVPDPNVRC